MNKLLSQYQGQSQQLSHSNLNHLQMTISKTNFIETISLQQYIIIISIFFAKSS